VSKKSEWLLMEGKSPAFCSNPTAVRVSGLHSPAFSKKVQHLGQYNPAFSLKVLLKSPKSAIASAAAAVELPWKGQGSGAVWRVCRT
jgi:hypothetical protein